MAQQDDDHELIGERIIFRNAESPYIVTSYVTGGAFGKLYLGKHEETEMIVAIKMESQDAEHRQLYLEYGFYVDVIGKCKFLPEIFTFGMVGNYYALVMALLGPSLHDLYIKCRSPPKGLTQKCIAVLGVKLTQIFEYVHQKGLIYRDVKPQNFLVGPSGGEHALDVYMIDLGLCKKWRQDNGKHIPFTDKHCVLGTAAFVSSAMHKGYELSRKDDLEAMMYMLVFMHKTKLPWSDPPGYRPTPEQWKVDFQRNGKMKQSIVSKKLCFKMNPKFAAIYRQIRKLGFETRPGYGHYIKKFYGILKDFKVDNKKIEKALDWDLNHEKKVYVQISCKKKSIDRTSSSANGKDSSKEGDKK